MKVLLIGGAYQGKGDYAMAQFGLSPEEIADGGASAPDLTAPAIRRLHLLVRRLLEEGTEAAQTVLEELDKREGWIVLCDEIGGGVVPVDGFDRRWREETGRLCCALAQRAHRVERITCGIPQRLKDQPC